MRVLLVTPWDQEFGGVAFVLGNVARHLREQGHEVFFLHPGDSWRLRARTTALGFPGFELNLRWFIEQHPLRSAAAAAGFLPLNLLQVARLVRQRRIDVVNVHYPIDSFGYFGLLRKLLPVRLVCSIHGADLFPGGRRKQRYPWGQRLLLGAADRVVAPSRNLLEQCQGVFPEVEAKGECIHTGIELLEFETHTSAAAPALGEPYLLCIAAHNEKKGIDQLLQAFATLGDLEPARKLLLVGDGPLRLELEGLAGELGLRDRVEFLGLQERAQVAQLLRGCEALVLPSVAEPFGIVLLEAMACGKPVVASAVGGIPEIVEHEKNGILVPASDPLALAQAIRRLLDDGELYRALSREAVRTVRERFDARNAGRAYEETFVRLAAQPSGPAE